MMTEEYIRDLEQSKAILLYFLQNDSFLNAALPQYNNHAPLSSLVYCGGIGGVEVRNKSRSRK